MPLVMRADLWAGQAVLVLGATRFIQIGERAGATLTLPASVLRGSGVEIIGSGAGSIAPERFMAEIPTVPVAAGRRGGLD